MIGRTLVPGRRDQSPWCPASATGRVERSEPEEQLKTDVNRTLSYLLGLVAVGLAANSILGPLATGVIRYRFSETLINQGIGLDAVALLAAVPVAVVAAVLVRRRHPLGPLLAFVPGAFAVYMAPQYVVGPEYLELAGNNERFFLFHLALFIAGVAVVVLAAVAGRTTAILPASERSDRRRSLVMAAVSAFILAGRWLPGLIGLTGGEPAMADYLENPTSYMLIGVLDLGLVVPAAILAAIGLRRHAEWARLLAYGVIGWFALVPAAVAAMAVTMVWRNDPAASTPLAVFFVAAALVFTAGAAALYRPVLARSRENEGVVSASRREDVRV